MIRDRFSKKNIKRNNKVKEDLIERPQSLNKFCRNCGNAVNERMVFCTNCGEKLNVKKNQELAETQNKPVQGLRKRSKVVFVLLIGLIYVVIIVGTFGYLYIRLHGWEAIPFIGKY